MLEPTITWMSLVVDGVATTALLVVVGGGGEAPPPPPPPQADNIANADTKAPRVIDLPVFMISCVSLSSGKYLNNVKVRSAHQNSQNAMFAGKAESIAALRHTIVVLYYCDNRPRRNVRQEWDDCHGGFIPSKKRPAQTGHTKRSRDCVESLQ